MKTLSLVIVFLVAFEKNDSLAVKSISARMDTLKPTLANIEGKCAKQTKGYYQKFGVIISNYYEIIDYLPYDINGDKKQDTLAILTPASLIADLWNVCGSKSNKDNRLLVQFINKNNKESRMVILPNVISNEVSRAWGGYEIFKKNPVGFSLEGDKGQGCKFEYSIYISKRQEVFFVDSLYYHYACPGGDSIKEKHIDYTKKKLKLSAYRREIIESIKKNM